jgi:hypothetical protein
MVVRMEEKYLFSFFLIADEQPAQFLAREESDFGDVDFNLRIGSLLDLFENDFT